VPFETLDTTSRCLTRHGGDVLVSDTVGFIRRLPARLLASFESTLSEIGEASLLVFVVDASDHEAEMHLTTTREIVEKIGAGDLPRFYVFNKIDRLPSPPTRAELASLCDGHPWAAISTHDAAAVEALSEALLRAARREETALSALVPYGEREVLALVYAKCRVLDSVAEDEGLRLRIEGAAPVISRIRESLGEERR
jgi:GTP-binding protein HflX